MSFFEGNANEAKNGCIEWKKCLNKFGYGVFIRKKKYYYAHRYFYEKKNGKIPNKMCALHKCDNRKCINPDHIFIGTRADNCRDMGDKRRSPSGIKNHMSKITEKQALKIRSDPRIYKEISIEYQICQATVSNIKTKKTWKYLT